jgi:hypothetical protein
VRTPGGMLRVAWCEVDPTVIIAHFPCFLSLLYFNKSMWLLKIVLGNYIVQFVHRRPAIRV